MTARKLVNLKCRLRTALALRDAKVQPFWSKQQRHAYRVGRNNALQYLGSERYQRDRGNYLAVCPGALVAPANRSISPPSPRRPGNSSAASNPTSLGRCRVCASGQSACRA
jgi:hypothetical protein